MVRKGESGAEHLKTACKLFIQHCEERLMQQSDESEIDKILLQVIEEMTTICKAVLSLLE